MSTAPVFLAERSLAGYAAGSTYLLDGAEGRHAGVVQRRSPGERVDVVDGAGTRLCCTVSALDGAGLHLTVAESLVEPEPEVALTLVQALAKGDRDELAIEAATEVGVDVVVPWQADRSVVVWRGDRAAKSRARWLATVRAATKQARRARCPVVELALDSRAVAARIAATTASGGLALVLHEAAVTSIGSVRLPGPVAVGGPAAAAAAAPAAAADAAAAAVGDNGPRPEVLVVVGPEGGIAPAELAAFDAAGAQTVRLGPHVLRTSTAGPVALGLLAERLGRWHLDQVPGN